MQTQEPKKVENEIDKYFNGDIFRYFVFLRSYSRWSDTENRRETWEEVVQRYISFMAENIGTKLTLDEYAEIHSAILNMEVMPSMRLMWSAGEPCRKNNIAAFNCSYVAIESLKDFADIVVILSNGCGLGFSCEKEAVNKLPVIKTTDIDTTLGLKATIYTIDDSKEGWADALLAGMTAWYNGEDINFDYSNIRSAGARLKTFGGRASGPGPLKELLDFTRNVILNAKGRQLTSLEVHDIVCKIGQSIVSGGVRRTALISLSDLEDKEMRGAKTGAFWEKEPQRSLSNNSAVYKEKPSQQEFMEEWLSLMKSGTGERGIFNRENFNITSPRRTVSNELVGSNPCGEINLLNKEFCNLTSVVCRSNDTHESLIRKIRIATILGTYQSMLTDFKYLSPKWKENCDKERLLGVSLNGQFDCPVVRSGVFLQDLKNVAIKTNEVYAKRFGINQSVAITAVKPEGTCSQLLNCSSGIHPRYAKYYIRRIRISTTDPLFKLFKDAGIKCSPEVGQSEETANTWVVEFPIKSPDGSITRHDLTAIDQLEYWESVKGYYTEHNPSMTCYVGEDEWLSVAKWVWDMWKIVGGIAFLPKEDGRHVYNLAPYEEITEEEYANKIRDYPQVDFSLLSRYEKEDATTGSHELACSANGCDIL